MRLLRVPQDQANFDRPLQKRAANFSVLEAALVGESSKSAGFNRDEVSLLCDSNYRQVIHLATNDHKVSRCRLRRMILQLQSYFAWITD